ncbi:MAG: glycosyltransferase family 2 protein [bacterium]
MSTVSAIVSAYYAEDYIEGRLNNLAKHDCQIIVVCQENSPEAQKCWEMLDVKFHRIIETPDIPTVYAAWNLGIKASTADYVTNANSDDRHYPDSLAVLQKALDDNPDIAVSYFDVDRFQGTMGSLTDRDNLLGQFTWAEGGFEQLMKGCFLGPMPMWRCNLHAKYGYFLEHFTVAGDYEFWLRIAKAGEKFYHIRQVYGAHLEHEGGLEHRAPLRTVWETAQARALHKEHAHEAHQDD